MQEVDGVWWFAQPSGDLFWSMGLNCVNVNTGSRLDDVVFKAWEKTPEKPLDLKPGIFSNSGWILNGDGREQYSFFIKNRLIKWRKEEADDKSIHREISRLKAWGFNSVGNWSSTAVQQQGKIPWFSMGPQTSEMKVPLIYKDIHDVYHPDFKKEAIQACKKLSEVSEDPYLVGHFILNEVRWNELVQQILDAKELFTSHARKELINQLQKKYLDIRDLSKAWNSSFDSWKTISFPKGILTPDAETDVAAFRGEFARQWYQIWAESIRHSDPNHLILGSRFDQNNRFPEVLGACGEFCDVVSINHYVQIPNRMEFDNIYKYGKKPIMIGEYGHNSFDKGALTAAIPVSSTQERAIMFSKYTETVASMPFVLGAHYFQYIDEPITGRSDGETGYNGFVSVVDIPWYPMVQAAKQTAKKIESIHKASK